MMGRMDRDWARLGSALRAARKDLHLEQQEVAERIGVKRGALRNIEIGDFSRVTPTVLAYARIVGWTDPSIEAVLAGGEATPAESSAPAAGAAPPGVQHAELAGVSPEELPLRIQAALAHGRVLDTAVIELPAAEGDEDPEGQMVIIVKGRAGASPEQIRKALLQWERTEAQLRRGVSGQ